MTDGEIKVDIKYKKLKKIVEEMSKTYSVRVGLLANKGSTNEVSENLDLAGLGAVQEFGCTINVTPKMRAYLHHKGIHLKETTTQIRIPARSFLAMPILNKDFRKKIKNNVGGDIDAFEYLIEQGDTGLLDVVANAVALGAVETIDEAFETNGFGNWAPNSPLTIAMKGSEMPLVDTGRLRGSITFEVNKEG